MTTESSQQPPPPRRLPRTLAAVFVGLIGSFLIWVASPYNTFVMNSQFIADSHLPVAALFLILLLVLIVNPLLHRFAKGLAFRRWQLGLILGIWLVACAVPSSGMLRQLPYSIARVPYDANQSEKLVKAYDKMALPSSLFPDKIVYKPKEVPAAKNFIHELPAGEPIPWRNWLAPLLAWGTFLFFAWLMMIGLSLIVFPQWRRNERLPFPLLTVQNALIEDPERGSFAPIFRQWPFWAAVGFVFMLHFLVGLNRYYPSSVPAIPIKWNLSSVFQDSFLRHLPGHIRNSRIYFTFVGMAFFMPTRIAFSIWFFELAYAVYIAARLEFAPPVSYAGVVYEQRNGAAVALALFILWLGRHHWLHVFRCVFRARNDEERRNRNAALMFSIGCIGMYVWLLWCGVQTGWAALYVGIAFIISLLITRLVAETGMSFVRIDVRYTISAVKLAPLAWLNAASLYFATVIAMLFALTSRTSAAALSTHALGLNEDVRPRGQMRLSWLFIGILMVGLVASGAVHVYANYHHSMPLDDSDGPLSPWGTTRITDKGHPDLLEWMQATEKGETRMQQTVYNQVGHMTIGAALCAACEWMCLRSPKWPLHPIGLVMNGTYYANQAWASVMLGWLLKVLLVKYGGARLYRLMMPVFLGLIMGEVFAAVYWSLDPAVRVLLGIPYKVVEVLPR